MDFIWLNFYYVLKIGHFLILSLLSNVIGRILLESTFFFFFWKVVFQINYSDIIKYSSQTKKGLIISFINLIFRGRCDMLISHGPKCCYHCWLGGFLSMSVLPKCIMGLYCVILFTKLHGLFWYVILTILANECIIILAFLSFGTTTHVFPTWHVGLASSWRIPSSLQWGMAFRNHFLGVEGTHYSFTDIASRLFWGQS